MTTKIMRAIRIHNHGGPEQLMLEQVPRPQPQAGEVLIRVHAAGVNPMDWKIRAGYLKDVFPQQFPYIPGLDLAGVIEEVGPGVTAFKPGQAVFGQSNHGSYAEYVVAPVTTLALKPERLSFDEAAALPVGATTAWQGLFDHGNLQAGQRVLILGAAGGVGLLAVQLARWKGAHVIGTTSTANLDFVRSLGTETVIDYTTTALESAAHDVDLVLNTVSEQVLESAWPALKPGGTLVSIAGQPSAEKASAQNIRTAFFAAQTNSELLDTFAHMANEGNLKVTIASRFPLHEAVEAQQLSESGHGRGRIVLHITD